MTADEQRAYLLSTLRKAPVGSSRRLWAEAMLKQLEPKPTQDTTQTTKSRRNS